MYAIHYEKDFLRACKKLTMIEQKQLQKQIAFLQSDIRYPSLNTKMLAGHNSIFESRVNMSIRFIWEFSDENTISLLDIGHHDILKQY